MIVYNAIMWKIRRMPGQYSELGELECHPQIPKRDGVEAFIEFLKEKGIVSSISD